MNLLGENIVSEDMQMTNRMESLMVAMGGYAHDFNNLLMVLTGHLGLAKRKTGDESVLEILSEAEQVCSRARDLTRRLSEISRNEPPERKLFSLRELANSISRMMASGAPVDFVVDMKDDALVIASRTQISQVLINLMINAVQAMPRGGTVTISVNQVDLKAEHGLPLPQGCYAKVSVRDEGVGIPKRLISKIFDCRFTTKQNGSGLGLTIAATIVGAHGGYIAVDSEEDIGSVFTFYLPVPYNK